MIPKWVQLVGKEKGVGLQCEGRDDWLYGDFNGFFSPLASVLNSDPSAGDGSHLNNANMPSNAT